MILKVKSIEYTIENNTVIAELKTNGRSFIGKAKYNPEDAPDFPYSVSYGKELSSYRAFKKMVKHNVNERERRERLLEKEVIEKVSKFQKIVNFIERQIDTLESRESDIDNYHN